MRYSNLRTSMNELDAELFVDEDEGITYEIV